MSLGPGHWESLYLEGRTPWDTGGVPQEMEDYLAGNPPGLRALVPGCGSAYEAGRLAASGRQVLAVDFSPAAVARARAVTAGTGAVIMEADFFELGGRCHDLIYERAFMCALAPDQRPDWARQCARLLTAGGHLAGLFFTDPDATDGPPFGIGGEQLESLLRPWFRRLEDRPSSGSLPVFAGRERWQLWQRNEAAAD
ncbi:MAG: methyltransferase domain-containing protein [Gammaproteobacteria bacterium]